MTSCTEHQPLIIYSVTQTIFLKHLLFFETGQQMYLTLFKFRASIPRCRVFHPEAGVKVADFLSNFASLETL